MTFMKKKQVFKLLILSLVIVLFAAFLSGCTEKQRKEIKHIKSDLIGLKRIVKLYDNNGKIIKTWQGRFKIEIQGCFLSFIDNNGKEVKISGTIVVQEQ
jgi:hypothetical protein